jgi:glycosyltransferase involved in cell wall biosynthesis
MFDDSIDVNNFDSVVMLTWSNWYTELRSNRYHYATRFAKICPVLFVQPDLDYPGYTFESTEIPNVTVVHLYAQYGKLQTKLLNMAMLESGSLRPIFWIYNGYFEHVVLSRYSVLNIYHGTEDYLASDSRLKIQNATLLESLNKILEECHLLIAVSDGVAESFIDYSRFNGKIITVPNGCDYKFYAPDSLNALFPVVSEQVVFYQGNIFDKLDYELLMELAKRMSTWQFVFCGKIIFNEPAWKSLCAMPNVKYIGLLSPEEIRAQAYRSTVGIIPFIESEWLIERSLPLKTFEYLASGLPVVSVPIKSILKYNDVILFASGVDQFEEAIKKAKLLRSDTKYLELCLRTASYQDYDLRFDVVNKEINTLAQNLANDNETTKLNVGILYNPSSISNTSLENISFIKQETNHEVFFVPVIQDMNEPDIFDLFDVIVIEYSLVNVSSSDGLVSPTIIEKLKAIGSYKVLLIQHNLQNIDEISAVIKKLGIHCLCMLQEQGDTESLHDENVFSSVKFISNQPLHDIHHSFSRSLDRLLSREVRLLKYRKQIISIIIGFKDNTGVNLVINPNNFIQVCSNQLINAEDFLSSKQVKIDLTFKQLYFTLFQLYKDLIIKIISRFYRKTPSKVKKIMRIFTPIIIKRRLRIYLEKLYG